MAPFEVSFAFLGTLRLLLGFGMSSKDLLGPTYIHCQLWFCKYSPIFLILFRPNLGLFFGLFGPLGAIFGVGVRFKNIFGTYLCRQSSLVFRSTSIFFVFNLAKFGASFALFWPFRAIFLGLRGLVRMSWVTKAL